ncbi:hypothetical protein T8S45_00255 [Blastomonas marina]|jgi:hypothetical protein|uniref:hypothetical protein n=1 Tax=Blastomonas marina TaxID=1867408 RepID=UPI002AC8B04E|nr:hypothetical protein [Blastomonas marina]WPZ04002.1 hypothetical protein T8S45_00255 [Blastomonas marina]
MKRALPFILPPLLAACSGGDRAAGEDQADYEVRVPLVTNTPSPVPAPPAPEQPDDAEWREGSDGRIEFGVEGSPPLLSMACEEGAFGVTRIAMTRHWHAPQGKAALLALVGNLRLRIPVDAQPPDRWTGSLESEDRRWRILEDRFSATLPGGGLLRLPASPLTRELLRSCRAESEDLEEAAEPPVADESEAE